MDIPEHVVEALFEIAVSLDYLNPRLAGGSVRDLLLGQPVKDWDIFTDNARILLPPLLEGWKIVANPKKEVIESYGTKPTKIGAFFKYSNTQHGTTIELICNGMKIEDFDHAICQCHYDLVSKRIVTTRHFEEAARNKIHKIFVKNLRTPVQAYKCFHDHTPRILAKYPWPLELCYE
jgi:hypothetical protein